MNVIMKKTAAAAFVALMLAGCGSSNDGDYFSRQAAEPVPTVKAIDYSKQSLQQLEKSATSAQQVLTNSQAKLTQVETQITEINRRITTLNKEISVLEKAEKPDANALKEKRDALAEANQALTVQNKILVVAQQDVKQAQINVTNVQNILIEKKAEQNKPPVVVVPEKPSQPSQPTQPEQPSEPEQPSKPTQPIQPEQPTEPAQPTIPPIADGERIVNLEGNSPISSPYRSVFVQYEGLNINNSDIQVDLGKLSNNQLGLYQGVFTHPDLVVRDGTGKNQLNYIVVNQPYSSYGVLSSDNIDDSEQRFAIYRAWEPGDVQFKGTATYKGGVIARITGRLNEESSSGNGFIGSGAPYSEAYSQDGTVEFTANFDKQRISGYLNSDRIGRVRLSETDIHRGSFSDSYTGQTLEGGKLSQGKYEGTVSANGKATVGYIDIPVNDKKVGGINGTYKAVYGATAQ